MFILFFFGCSKNVYADMDGGVVQTNGVLEFHEEESTQSTTTSSSLESQESTTDSSSVTWKPDKKYPSTGELIGKSLFLSGIFILLLYIAFFFKKKIRRGEGE